MIRHAKNNTSGVNSNYLKQLLLVLIIRLLWLQLKRDSQMQEELLKHLLQNQGAFKEATSTGHSSPDSSKSSRSISPIDKLVIPYLPVSD